MSEPTRPCCGGTGECKPADEQVQNLINDLKDDISAKSDGRDYSNLKAVNYKTQVVNGTNYFVKAKAHDGKHVHLRIHKALPVYGGKAELSSVQHDKSADDEIGHF